MLLLISLATGVILAICAAVGWTTASGYALGLLIGGGIVALAGAILASEPLIGRSRARRGLEETDEARAEERRKDRPVDRTVFDLMGTVGVLVMGIGVAIYLIFG